MCVGHVVHLQGEVVFLSQFDLGGTRTHRGRAKFSVADRDRRRQGRGQSIPARPGHGNGATRERNRSSGRRPAHPRKPELEADAIFDFLESGIRGVGENLGRRLEGLLPGNVARRIQAVNADVGQRAPSGQSPLLTPLIGPSLVLAVRRLDQSNRAELA